MNISLLKFCSSWNELTIIKTFPKISSVVFHFPFRLLFFIITICFAIKSFLRTPLRLSLIVYFSELRKQVLYNVHIRVNYNSIAFIATMLTSILILLLLLSNLEIITFIVFLKTCFMSDKGITKYFYQTWERLYNCTNRHSTLKKAPYFSGSCHLKYDWENIIFDFWIILKVP